MREHKFINTFRGKYAFLSNFYAVPVTYKGHKYPSAENAYQAQKTDNLDVIKSLIRCDSKEATVIGKRVRLKPDWNDTKQDIMYEIVKAKFDQHKALQTELRNTADAYLVEGNEWHDNYWGCCYCDKCADEVAHNHLGKILMQVRKELE